LASLEDSEALYKVLITTLTKHFPSTPLGQRTDCVMDLYQGVHKWATGEEDEIHGATNEYVDMAEYVVTGSAPMTMARAATDN
jgi:hypothetical protein